MALTGKVAIVTGAARGIGQATALALSREGALVVLGDLAECTETLAAIHAHGHAAVSMKMSITRFEDCKLLVELAIREFGHLDVLVNNAGLFASLKPMPFQHVTIEQWQDCLNVNLTGTWNMCRAAVEPMITAGNGGSIINVGSATARVGTPWLSHYAVSKAAVMGLTRCLANELGSHKIRVNSVAPSGVLTEGTRELLGDSYDTAMGTMIASQSIQRPTEAADVAEAIVYLAGDGAAMMSGHVLPVDGGLFFTS